MLKPCQNAGIPMHSNQTLLLESAESEAGILMGADFLCKVFKPSCLQMQKDRESKLSLSLSLRKMYLALCVCTCVFALAHPLLI